MSWMIVSFFILVYVWYSLYRAIRREGKIKPVVWAVVIVLALGMMIPAGNLTQWGKGSWPLIFDRPQMQDQNKPLYSEVFPFKEKPAVVISWNAIVDEIDMLGNEACSLNVGSVTDWKINSQCQQFLIEKLGKDNFCMFVDAYNRFENDNIEIDGCPRSAIYSVSPEELSTWIDKHQEVRTVLLDNVKVLSAEVVAQLDSKLKKAIKQIKDILADVANVKIGDGSDITALESAVTTIDDAISRIMDVRLELENMAGGNFRDMEVVLGVIDDVNSRLDEVKGYIDKVITLKQNIDMMTGDKTKYTEEYQKKFNELKKILTTLPKELEFALSGMENVITTLKEVPPAIDIIKGAKWYQVKLDNPELFAQMGGVEGYEHFMQSAIKKFAEKEGIQSGLSGMACQEAMDKIKPYVRCEFTKTMVDRQLKGCPASVFFKEDGESSGYKEDLLSKVESDCYGVEDIQQTETTQNNITSQSTCTVSDVCQCSGENNQNTKGEKKETFTTYVIIDDGNKQKKVAVEGFVPSGNICRAVYDRFDTSFEKVFRAEFESMYCSGATVNIASFINPYFGTQSYYIVSENDRKPLRVLSTRGLVEISNANKPNSLGILIFTLILALIIGGMEMMLRLFLPPIISSTSQYGGSSWVWLIVIGIMVFFLEAFFAFTIGGLLVTWWNVLGLPPIIM